MRLPDFFDKSADAHPDAPAVISDGQTWTYATLQSLSRHVAGALSAQHLPPGTKVATWVPNDALFFALQLGIHRTDLIWMPLNPRATADDCIAMMRAFGAAFLFLHHGFAPPLAAIQAQVPGLLGIVAVAGDIPGVPDLQSWLDAATPASVDADVQPGDVVTLLTTGGSTGGPKGVMRLSMNWAALITNYALALPSGRPPVNLVATPLTHVAGELAQAVFAQGGVNVILARPDPALILRSIPEHGITHLFVPPTLLYTMLAQPDATSHDYSSLRYLMYGAAPIAVEKLREAWRTFGPVMTQLYGLMEATSTVAIMTPAEHAAAFAAQPARLGSCGRGSPTSVIDVVDAEGRSAEPGENGEVVCRGQNLLGGYQGNPEATRAAIRGGWFHTGDIGAKDHAGYVRLVDRTKDIIISGGFNVFPGEVEQVIWTHPAVQDCAVIGAPDEKWGEAVTAVVECKPGQTVDPDALIALCKQKLGSIKAPKRVLIWPELPRSTVGKVLKKDVRAHFWQDQGRNI